MGSGYVPTRQPPSLLQVSLILLMTGILRAEPQVLASLNDSTPTTAPSSTPTTGPTDEGMVVAAYDPEASITGLYTGPYFDPLTPRNMTAHLGDEAKLPCTVRQLGDKSVSWVRVRDADILTVDRYTFVGDERFESHYSTSTETWNLVIKYVQERDAGEYECQVSTEPKMSQLFSLRVVIPKVMIVPVGDRYVKAGSTVRVDCQITDVVQLPDYIFWYHEDKRVMDRRDPNLLVTVKRTDVEAIASTLTIHKVRQEQSGNYTCMPSNLHAASVTLHVLNEKHPAAMQGERNSACSADNKLTLTLALLVCILVWSMTVGGSEGDNNRKATAGQEEEEAEEEDPITTTPALATSRTITRPFASTPSLPCPSLSTAVPLVALSNQEHQKVAEMLWELLTNDDLLLAQEGNGYVQDKDQLTRASQIVGTRTWGARVLRHLDKAQVALDLESHPSSYLMKPREAQVQVLEEAVGLPSVGKEEGEKFMDDSSPEEQRSSCLATIAVAHQQMQLVSSVTQGNKSCRSIGRVLMARQR